MYKKLTVLLAAVISLSTLAQADTFVSLSFSDPNYTHLVCGTQTYLCDGYLAGKDNTKFRENCISATMAVPQKDMKVVQCSGFKCAQFTSALQAKQDFGIPFCKAH